jgi:hypothetical protein
MKITIHFCISFKTTELVKVALNTKKTTERSSTISYFVSKKLKWFKGYLLKCMSDVLLYGEYGLQIISWTQRLFILTLYIGLRKLFLNIATSKKARGDNSRNKCKLNITKIYSKYFWEQQLSLWNMYTASFA